MKAMSNEARLKQRINLRDPESVKFWAQAFGLSGEDLSLAVRTEGNWPGAIAYLLRSDAERSSDYP